MSAQAFGKRLARLRRQKAVDDDRDLDRRDIAKAIGVSPSSITRWENGEVWPGEDAMTDLAKFFGVTRAWLRYGEGESGAAPANHTVIEDEGGEALTQPGAARSAGKAAAGQRDKRRRDH